MVANFLSIELEFLDVEVTADVDVRGAMVVDRKVPVGFQSMNCNVRLRAKDGTNPEHIETLRVAAEHQSSAERRNHTPAELGQLKILKSTQDQCE